MKTKHADYIHATAADMHAHIQFLRPKIIWALAIFCWLAAIGFGYLQSLNYDGSPGLASINPEKWPSRNLSLAPDKLNLVMFVHPKCPCSRASIHELSVLMTRCNNLSATILFVKPAGTPSNWERTDLWCIAANIPGVKVKTDLSRKEANLFDANTSGETLVYDQTGTLVFSGGITAGRTHEGDNQGLSIIQALAAHAKVQNHRTPVFGCAL